MKLHPISDNTFAVGDRNAATLAKQSLHKSLPAYGSAIVVLLDDGRKAVLMRVTLNYNGPYAGRTSASARGWVWQLRVLN